MRLSILICTIPARKKLLDHLLKMLKEQMDKQVEILVEKDDEIITIGAKRNLLLERAKGDYICFMDDDDEVSDYYIFKILQALKTNPDCCSLIGEIVRRGRRRLKFIHSIEYDSWFEKAGIYYRCPNHLNTVRRDLAIKIKFPNSSQDEDINYSLRLRPLLKTEAAIKGVIYFYRKDY